MGIGNIGQFGGIHNSYLMREIPKADGQEIQGREQGQNPPQSAGITGQEEGTERRFSDIRRRNVELEDISLTFHRGDGGNTTGRDRDILSLDMQKAISDMKKDSILEDYQYFVGSSRNLKAEDEGLDGLVRLKSAT